MPVVEENFKVQLGLAANFAKNKEFDRALATLKSLNDSYEPNELVLGMMGGIYFQIGMTEKAALYYRDVLAINDKNDLARLQLGLAKVALEQREEALEIWAPMRDRADDFVGHFHSGIVLLELKREKEGLDLIKTARHNMPPSHPYQEKAADLIRTYEGELE